MTLGTQILSTGKNESQPNHSFSTLSLELTEHALDGILTEERYDEILTTLYPMLQSQHVYLEAYLRLVYEGEPAWRDKHLTKLKSVF
jgi:hypothetical protein